MDGIFSVLASPIPFIVLISIVITVHELGHYWVGRGFGAAVESFSVGFGRPIFEVRDKRGTRWRVNWLPLGGFVKFVGELQAPTDTRETPDAAPSKADPAPVKLVGKAYTELGPMKRLAVSLGGPLANFIFAIAVFAVLGMAFGIPQSKEIMVASVVPNSAASVAGFQPGDVIVEAGGRTVSTGSDVNRATELSAGEAVMYRVVRDGSEMTLQATPLETEETNAVLQMKQKVGRIGIALTQRDTEIRHLNPIEAVGYGFSSTGDALGATVNVLRRLVTGKEGLDKLSGPVGIFTLADKVTDLHLQQKDVDMWEKWRQLFFSLLQLSALLSIGVGFFNLLPIPVLDGGAAVMCLAEAATGKEIPEKVQRVGLTIGLVSLVSFALLITWQDIARLWPGGS
ncbi:MAG: M50 family metallopeptidase [Hyphomonadaceae bacterium]|nr:M50 family metallopeptidase [Hyphomonadaceae bacterium]